MTRRQSRGTVALVAAVAMLVAGCGGGGGGHSAAAPAAASHPTATKASFAEYRQCLAAHGIARATERPTARPTPGLRRQLDPAQVQAFQAARQACQADRPAGGFRAGMFSHHQRSGIRECMKDHGITLPRPPMHPTAGPTPTEDRGGMFADLNRHDPAVQKALTACRAELLGKATPQPSPTS
ncbi:MAG TPA: hypothetical protein VGJ14_14785 [Sporichthyaceae bacterium]